MAGRVLVVEDEPGIRGALVTILGDDGYQVDEAANGTEALAALARQAPDVIVLDLIMPVMDGWEFEEHRRAEPAWQHIPVLVLSAFPRSGWDRERIRGAMAYLPKPFKLETLLEKVRFLYEYSQSRQRAEGRQPTER